MHESSQSKFFSAINEMQSKTMSSCDLLRDFLSKAYLAGTYLVQLENLSSLLVLSKVLVLSQGALLVLDNRSVHTIHPPIAWLLPIAGFEPTPFQNSAS